MFFLKAEGILKGYLDSHTQSLYLRLVVVRTIAGQGRGSPVNTPGSSGRDQKPARAGGRGVGGPCPVQRLPESWML